MSKIDTSKWEQFNVGDLFDIHPTKAYKMTNSMLMENDGEYPVIVNSSYNNGVGGFTNQKPTENGNIITFSDTTSADAIFYQKKSFVGYPHIQGMYPKEPYKSCWCEASFLFFLVVFRKKAINLNYDYVNKFTRASAAEMSVLLPVDENHQPDFSYMESYMSKLEVTVKDSLAKLQLTKQFTKSKSIITDHWKSFHIYDIFNIDSGTKFDKVRMNTSEQDINFVGRSNKNNGITERVAKIEGIEPYSAGYLTLALGGEYLGSCFIQPMPFYTSQNVVVLIPKEEISFFTKQFIATAIFIESQNNYRAFIKELNAHIKKDFAIKLPADKNGNPDYAYMENYMKAVESKAHRAIQYLTTV